MVGLLTGDAPHEIVAPEANRQMVGLAAGAEREGRSRAVPGGGGVRRKPTAAAPEPLRAYAGEGERRGGGGGGGELSCLSLSA